MATVAGVQRVDPRSLQMGLDIGGQGRVNQVMTGPLGVDVDNDGEVDVIITPEMLRAFALSQGTPVSQAGQDIRKTQPAPPTPPTVPVFTGPPTTIQGPPAAPVMLPPTITTAPAVRMPMVPTPAQPAQPAQPARPAQPAQFAPQPARPAQFAPQRPRPGPVPVQVEAYAATPPTPPQPKPAPVIRKTQRIVEKPVEVVEYVYHPMPAQRPPEKIKPMTERPANCPFEWITVPVKTWTPVEHTYHDPRPDIGCTLIGAWEPEHH